MAVDFDAVASGDVASLARPGGRVAGVTAMQSTMPAKRLELLKEMLAGIGKAAAFTNWDGEDQTRLIAVSGDELKITSPVSAVGGGIVHLVLRRAK